MDRYSDRNQYDGGEGRRRERDDAEGYGRSAMGPRDYSTSGRYFDDDEDRRRTMRHFEEYGGSRYPDRERDYNMGGYGGGRHQDEFYMRGEDTGRGEEGGGYGFAPSDDYERTGYGRGSARGAYSDRDFDSERYAWRPGDRSRSSDRSGYGGRSGRVSMNSGYDMGSWAPGPHTGRGPKGYERSTDRIKEEVCDRLAQHGRIDATDIEVRVENGEVTLSGTIDSREVKRLAEDIVESVGGIRDVHNQLRINRSANRNAEQRQQESGENGHPTGGRGTSRKPAQS